MTAFKVADTCAKQSENEGETFSFEVPAGFSAQIFIDSFFLCFFVLRYSSWCCTSLVKKKP